MIFKNLKEKLSIFIRTRLAQKKLKNEFKQFINLSQDQHISRIPVWNERYPCLDDSTESTAFDRHYIYHPAWAARILAKIAPKSHIDISSTLHFCTILSAFIETKFYDYRPAQLKLSGLESLPADLLALEWPDNSIESLSCMHVIEHIGLGRYGDPLDPQGDIKAIKELVRVIKPGGHLLVAVPVGKARICFNAHRIYGNEQFISYFTGMDLVEMSLIPDGDAPDGLLPSPSNTLVDSQHYGCGCYWFRKPFN